MLCVDSIVSSSISEKYLIINAFPGEGIKVYQAISCGDSQWVQEHYEENYILLDNSVIICAYSKVFIDDQEGNGGVLGTYWNPRTQKSYTVDFSTLSITEVNDLAFTPNPMKPVLEGALNGSFQVFFPIQSTPSSTAVCLSSKWLRDAGNYTTGNSMLRFDTPIGMGILAGEMEVNVLNWEDCVCSLTISVRYSKSVSSIEESIEWINKSEYEGIENVDGTTDYLESALKQLRRQLPVHKQKFDWNINRIANLIL
jgi:F-actin capping protein alpha subunit